jgi:hypothetical protein
MAPCRASRKLTGRGASIEARSDPCRAATMRHLRRRDRRLRMARLRERRRSPQDLPRGRTAARVRAWRLLPRRLLRGSPDDGLSSGPRRTRRIRASPGREGPARAYFPQPDVRASPDSPVAHRRLRSRRALDSISRESADPRAHEPDHGPRRAQPAWRLAGRHARRTRVGHLRDARRRQASGIPTRRRQAPMRADRARRLPPSA